MKKIALALLAGALIITTYSCKKDKKEETPNTTMTFTEMEGAVLTDFATKTAIPQYQSLQEKATALNTAVVKLNANLTAANLDAARTAWKNTREVWEQTEGFLLGPVEDDNYDPNMDTWPVDYHAMDSLLASNNALNVADIEQLPLSLRGFHPIEYILWGKDGNKVADSINARERKYLSSLVGDVVNNTTRLHNSWLPNGGNFQDQVVFAGQGSDVYDKRQEAFIAIAEAMAGICEEVGGGKINDPFVAQDSTLTESPFSHNSMIDFKNNIIGAQKVYLCSFNQGKSISDIVAYNNAALDTKIKQQFDAAISSFGNVTTTFEQAIYTQPSQLQLIQDALETLQTTLNDELTAYMVKYIQD